jgi:hypothetical protein
MTSLESFFRASQSRCFGSQVENAKPRRCYEGGRKSKHRAQASYNSKYVSELVIRNEILQCLIGQLINGQKPAMRLDCVADMNENAKLM